eukprot:SAG11_NODE_1396_length_5036_cov_2.382824_2_plen_84_part_00
MAHLLELPPCRRQLRAQPLDHLGVCRRACARRYDGGLGSAQLLHRGAPRILRLAELLLGRGTAVGGRVQRQRSMLYRQLGTDL